MRLSDVKVAAVPLCQRQATVQPHNQRNVPCSLMQGPRLAPHCDGRGGLSHALPRLAELFEHGWQQLGVTALAHERQRSAEVSCRLVVGV